MADGGTTVLQQEVFHAHYKSLYTKKTAFSQRQNPYQPRGVAMKRRKASRLAVMQDHREQWRALVDKVREDLEMGEADAIKALKVYAETLKIIQEGERKAWGIDEAALRPKSSEASGTPELEILRGDQTVSLLSADNADEPDGDAA